MPSAHYRMRCHFTSVFIFVIQYSLFFPSLIQARNAPAWSKWSNWNKCSASCEFGVQKRFRICSHGFLQRCPGRSKEFRPCHIAICPSYLDWPRLHFSGRFVANTPTANNYRCNFYNDRFYPLCNTFRQVMTIKETKKGTTAPQYLRTHGSKNPMGNGHFYFTSTKVTSACWDAATECRTGDAIVGRRVQGTTHARIVDLDPDWQKASEVIGFHMLVDGVFKAKMVRSSITHNAIRYPGVGDHAMSPSIKSKLVNVKWIDKDFKRKFRNATSLSTIFVMDAFNYTTMTGRLTGTIGMTSRDDPITLFGARTMRPFNPSIESKWEVPFHINYKQKKILLDLSNVIKCDKYGNFSYSSLKHFDVVLLSNGRNCPGSSFECLSRLLHCHGKEFYLLTQGGALDEVHKNVSWYDRFGGILEISLSWTDDKAIHWLSQTRLGLVNRSQLDGESPKQTKKALYTFCDIFPWHCTRLLHLRDHLCSVIALEQVHGINFKPMKHWTARLTLGETWNVPTVVTSFGKPLRDAEVRLQSIKRSYPHVTCHKKKPCHRYIGRPRRALQLGPPTKSSKNGLVNLSVKVIRNIGFPRSCGLDGQVYPMGIIVRYTDCNGKSFSMGDGGMFGNAISIWYSDALNQCKLKATYQTFTFGLKVFSSLPASVMRKTCPSWDEDVRPIFQFYYNLFPVMAKHDIINLRNIDSVRSKLHLINMSMFEFPWDHPNFMPTTRDLSPDKTEIVRRWIECEVYGPQHLKDSGSSLNQFDEERSKICGSPNNRKKSLSDLREHLQTALLIELYTIPPYLTALFSLKQEKFKHAAEVLKTISTEEMLHMALNSNVLNAVGGNPKLTEIQWIPSYPTSFPSRHFYELRPDLTLKLEPYSKQLAKEIFSEIEKPPPLEVMETLHDIALLWRHIPADYGGKWLVKNATGVKKHKDQWFRGRKSDETKEPLWLRVAAKRKTSLLHNRTNRNELWNHIFHFSTQELKKPHIKDVYSIGGFYAHVMLRLLQIESCVKTNSTGNNTIFTGNPKRQLGHKQFYATKGRTSSVLFPVKGLKSAIEALFEVTYQGEGGTPCAPFITSVAENFSLSTSFVTNSKDPYLSEISPFGDTSHYIKFQELAHGRRLRTFNERPPNWSKLTCLPKPGRLCGCSDANDNFSCVIQCFAGESLDFDESNSIWPIANLPYHKSDLPHMSNKTFHAVVQFDHTYTTMLHCLEKAMNGDPLLMATCTANMYELVDAGKRLVQMPLYDGGDPNIGPNAGPQWTYLPDNYEAEGPIVSDLIQSKPVFC